MGKRQVLSFSIRALPWLLLWALSAASAAAAPDRSLPSGDLIGYWQSGTGTTISIYKSSAPPWTSTMRIVDSRGHIVREWAEPKGYPSASPRGRYALFSKITRTEKETSTSFEAVSANGETVWKQVYPEVHGMFISDSAMGLELPSEDFGRFAIYDSSGNITPIKRPEWRPLQVHHEWSPSGKSLLLYHIWSPRLRCITPETGIDYEVRLSTSNDSKIRNAVIREDCGVAAIVVDRQYSPQESARLVTVTPDGIIRTEAPISLPGIGNRVLEMNPAGDYLAYFEKGAKVAVIDRSTLRADYEFHLTGAEAISRIVFANDKDHLFVVYATPRPTEQPKDRTIQSRMRSFLCIRTAVRGVAVAADRCFQTGYGIRDLREWPYDPRERVLQVPTLDGPVPITFPSEGPAPK